MPKLILSKGSICLQSILIIFIACSCTFNYGDSGSSGEELPDLVMENVEYMRVRNADPLARIQADRFERYEKLDLIKVKNIVFEQYGERGEEVNVYGRAGRATVYIESQDISMENNVNLEIQTEDIVLETYQLDWQDEPRLLSTEKNNKIHIYRDNGTMFTGTGLQARTRTRTWEFLGEASGVYIHDDEEDESSEGK